MSQRKTTKDHQLEVFAVVEAAVGWFVPSAGEGGISVRGEPEVPYSIVAGQEGRREHFADLRGAAVALHSAAALVKLAEHMACLEGHSAYSGGPWVQF